MSDTILKCGNFSVRSSKARDRIKTARANNLAINTARYQFSGSTESEIQLNGNHVALTVHDDSNTCSTGADCQALFFDQTPYMFSIKFSHDTNHARLFSPLATWCDSADWDQDSKKLLIPINFGNDLGDFELCWEWETDDGEHHSASFSGQVFSTKLDIYEHFNIMLDEVTERFEWIRLDLLRQTTWGWSHDSDSEGNLRTWLVIFQEVQQTMDCLLRKLVKQHRRRLIAETRMLRPGQMRKISPKVEELIVRGMGENDNRRYPVEKKVLDADTPENRYIKHILLHTLIHLHELIDKIEPLQRIADVFKERLSEWADGWEELKQHRFWRGIGEFHGLQHESQILSQDPLYAGIRRSWYLLQQGLKFIDSDLKGGIQNAAQLYEIWCLVKIDQLIANNGWKCVADRFVDFEPNDDLDSEELQSGTVKFSYYKEGLEQIKLEILFQPTAGATPGKNGIWDGMLSLPVVQKPDIVLRLHRNDLPHQPVYTWIFDAKYRLNNNNAPDDAVNQMHRYRDAIVWSNEAQSSDKPTREGIGAYVLYPGNEHNLSGQSPQIASIDKTNIGAFPLRPNRIGEGAIPKLLQNIVILLRFQPLNINPVIFLLNALQNRRKK